VGCPQKNRKEMFFTLKTIEHKLENVINKLGKEFEKDDCRNMTLLYEIEGIKKAIKVVQKEGSKELTELDKWATTEMLRRD
tara:strand:- start:1255 stop:1497 length:243 start_codon:yes stop_codon:yes gene_type:complete